jgi:hypothetical protein
MKQRVFSLSWAARSEVECAALAFGSVESKIVEPSHKRP